MTGLPGWSGAAAVSMPSSASARCAVLVVDKQNSFVQQEASHAWVPVAVATHPAIERMAARLRTAGGSRPGVNSD